MRSPRQRCAWLWVGAFLTSLLGGLVVAPVARAECGSHAVAQSHHTGSGGFSHLSALLRGTPPDHGAMPTAPSAPAGGPAARGARPRSRSRRPRSPRSTASAGAASTRRRGRRGQAPLPGRSTGATCGPRTDPRSSTDLRDRFPPPDSLVPDPGSSRPTSPRSYLRGRRRLRPCPDRAWARSPSPATRRTSATAPRSRLTFRPNFLDQSHGKLLREPIYVAQPRAGRFRRTEP